MVDYNLINENEYQSKVQKDENGNLLPYKVTDKREFPAIYFEFEQVTGYLAKLIKATMQPCGDEDSLVYTIYLKTPKGVLRIGKSTASILRIVLNSDMFNNWNVYAYLNESTKVTGDNLFALY